MEYFRRSPRLDITEDTKLNADSKSSDDFYSVTLDGKNNFITEVFFLTAAAHHYGLNAAETSHDNLMRDIPELERHLQLIEAERIKYQNVHSPILFMDPVTDEYRPRICLCLTAILQKSRLG